MYVRPLNLSSDVRWLHLGYQVSKLSKEEGKDQESIQPSTTPDPEVINTQENINLNERRHASISCGYLIEVSRKSIMFLVLLTSYNGP